MHACGGPIRRADCPGRHAEAPGHVDPLRQSAEEAQEYCGGDQVGRGGRKGSPLPQGGEAAAGGLSVSVAFLMPFFFLLLRLMFFQTLFLKLSNRAPLSLGRVPAASIVGAVGGSSNSRRVDPRADLLEATEGNTREAREEREAEERRAAREAEQKSAEARAVAAAKAQTEAADAEREAEAEALRDQPQQFVIPLHAAAPDTPVPLLEEAGHG